MQKFEIPTMELSKFDVEDIIVASGTPIEPSETQAPGDDNETGIY